MIKDILGVVPDLTKFADSSFESEQERQETNTRRLTIDTTSPFMLPHLIRPLSTLWSGFLWGVSIIWTLIIASVLINKVGIKAASAMIMSSDSIIMYILAATTTTYGTHIGFYFSSRKAEKINAKKVQAAIEIESEKAKVQILRSKQDLKEEKKQNRRDRRSKP